MSVGSYSPGNSCLVFYVVAACFINLFPDLSIILTLKTIMYIRQAQKSIAGAPNCSPEYFYGHLRVECTIPAKIPSVTF